jgi:hypothetical protein
MREIRLYGSEGGGIEINRSSLPLSRRFVGQIGDGPGIQHEPSK